MTVLKRIFGILAVIFGSVIILMLTWQTLITGSAYSDTHSLFFSLKDRVTFLFQGLIMLAVGCVWLTEKAR